MWQDEIVEETRRARDEYSAKFSYDLEAIYKDLHEKEKQNKSKVVSLQPKEPVVIPQAKAS